MSGAVEVSAGEAIDSIVLPSGVVEGLIAGALLSLNDGLLEERYQVDRLFSERIDRMAQLIVIALVCAQVLESDDDFEQALAHRPFAQGDSQAGEVGALIVEMAQAQFAEIDAGVVASRLTGRVMKILGAV